MQSVRVAILVALVASSLVAAGAAAEVGALRTSLAEVLDNVDEIDSIASLLKHLENDEDTLTHLAGRKATDTQSVSLVVGALKKVAAERRFGGAGGSARPLEMFAPVYLDKLMAACANLKRQIGKLDAAQLDKTKLLARHACKVASFDTYFENQLAEMWFHGAASDLPTTPKARSRLTLLAKSLAAGSGSYLAGYLERVLFDETQFESFEAREQLPLDETKRIEWARKELVALRDEHCKLTEPISENLLWLLDGAGLKLKSGGPANDVDESRWLQLSRACAQLRANLNPLGAATRWSKSMNLGDVLQRVLRSSSAGRGASELRRRADELRKSLLPF